MGVQTSRKEDFIEQVSKSGGSVQFGDETQPIFVVGDPAVYTTADQRDKASAIVPLTMASSGLSIPLWAWALGGLGFVFLLILALKKK